MRPSTELKDDRLFRLEIVKYSGLREGEWVVDTLHNVRGRIPAGQNHFESREDALDYYLKVVVETPRASLDCRPPDPLPSIAQYTAWLKSENISDPVLNPGDTSRMDQLA